jgi:DNA-binding NarL/FixJ family response regulator
MEQYRSAKPIRILIVDDHPALRAGLVSMLMAYDDRFDVVAQAASAEEAAALASAKHPDVVLTDYDLGKGQPTGVDLIKRLKGAQPDIRHMLITAFTDDEYLLLAHDAGASAFLEKNTHASDLARAIEAVASGFTQFPERLRAALARRDGEPKLTQRELDLLPFIAQGLTAKAIARELNRDKPDSITDRTVEVHKGNIKRKFHLNSSSALTSFAIDYCQSHRIAYKPATH